MKNSNATYHSVVRIGVDADFADRLKIAGLDYLILGLLLLPFMFTIRTYLPEIWEIRIPFFWLAYFPYRAFMDASKYQGTIGRQLMGFKTTDILGNRISLRASFIRSLYASIFPIGVLHMLFDKSGRTWHDYAAGTRVIER